MSRLIYATQIVCDRDGTTAQVPHSPDNTRLPPDPPGWTCLGGYGIQRPDGSFARDFCPACSALPFGQVVTEMLAPSTIEP